MAAYGVRRLKDTFLKMPREYEVNTMNIITLTFNPAFDIHCNVPNFAPYHENLAYVISRDAGGKGVNISRALTVCGVDNLAFVVLGDENGDGFERALKDDGMCYKAITVKGRIRENMTFHTEGMPETRVSFQGFSLSRELFDRAIELLFDDVDENTVLTFTGRAPTGIDISQVKELLVRFAHKGAKIVIDSRSFSLDDLRQIKPWLIKPNQEEISEYLGREIDSFEQIVSVAKELHKDGIENVMISLGSEGAMLVCNEGIFVAKPPRINAISTIGAGDSSIAGFLAAAKMGEGAENRLCTAVAYGSAACLTEGTRPPRREDVIKLLPLVNLKTVK